MKEPRGLFARGISARFGVKGRGVGQASAFAGLQRTNAGLVLRLPHGEHGVGQSRPRLDAA